MRDSYFDLPSRIEDAFAEIDSDIVIKVRYHYQKKQSAS